MTNPACHTARSDRGSGTLLTLVAGLLLTTALAMAVVWSAISIARHKLTAAADLAALSAAESVNPESSTPRPPSNAANSTAADPTTADDSVACATAERIAALHQATLAACEVTAETVTIRLTRQLHLAGLAHPTVTATARAGPV